MVQLVDIPVLQCHRCAYAWRPSQPVVRICPRCKSERWDVPKVRRDLGRQTGLGIAEVIGTNREQVLRLARRHGARNVRVFGSVRRGQATARSDVDFLVDYREGADLFDEIHLMRDLRKLLERPVEVTTEDALHPLVRAQVMYEAVPL
ncbi:MAG: nucleotidyltransferase domain-containing protein [Thermoplasmata archaeon]|nr:nucleotidyltransferase domain-containing protein [Thermoplasmata archaeon]